MQIDFLPLDLASWDVAPAADLIAVSIWSDVRPLRGAAGLLDWRLSGFLSHCLRQGRLDGSSGEKLLLPTTRLPWKRVLLTGLGSVASFQEMEARAALTLVVDAMHGLGLGSLVLAVPGRDADLLSRATAQNLVGEILSGCERITLLDRPSGPGSV